MTKHLPFLLLLIALLGCAPKSVEEYNNGESEEEITKLLNERQYGKAVWIIEGRHGKRPADQKMAFLLGQAYLGKIGFEPLLIAARVSDEQTFATREAQLLFPDCRKGRVKEVKGAELLCLLKRIYVHVPDPDTEEFTRARELFRLAYPDPASSPEWVNILIGMVETASVVKRVGAIYVMVLSLSEQRRTMPADEELEWFVRQVKRTFTESEQALKRADHSGKAISQFLTGSNNELFDKARTAISWANMLGLPAFLDVVRSNVLTPDQDARYAEALDKLRKLLEDQTLTLRKL